MRRALLAACTAVALLLALMRRLLAALTGALLVLGVALPAGATSPVPGQKAVAGSCSTPDGIGFTARLDWYLDLGSDLNTATSTAVSSTVDTHWSFALSYSGFPGVVITRGGTSAGHYVFDPTHDAAGVERWGLWWNPSAPGRTVQWTVYLTRADGSTTWCQTPKRPVT